MSNPSLATGDSCHVGSVATDTYATIGDIVTVLYYDHIKFTRSARPEDIGPIMCWTVGLIKSETADYLTLLHEIYPCSAADCKVPEANGLVIRKADIIKVTLLAESKTTLNKRVGKGIKTIKLTQKPLSMRSRERKTQQGSLRK